MGPKGLKHIYGPVPSRRLGRSLGIDLVPFKTCTYDCVYCQLGRTTNKTLERKEYVANCDILAELKEKLTRGATFDYISLAGSGEPTLNSGINELILQIRKLTDIPIAVLTNGSLLWMPEVRDALLGADLVLPSLDAGDEFLFKYANRPHGNISFGQMVEGLVEFTNRFPGEVWLEILLLAGVTRIRHEVQKIAAIIGGMKLSRIQLNTVKRPPAETFAAPLLSNQMLTLKNIFSGPVEIISDFDRKCEDQQSAIMRDDIRSLLARRPCTSSDVAGGLGIHWSEAIKHLETLTKSGDVKTILIKNQIFYGLPGASCGASVT